MAELEADNTEKLYIVIILVNIIMFPFTWHSWGSNALDWFIETTSYIISGITLTLPMYLITKSWLVPSVFIIIYLLEIPGNMSSLFFHNKFDTDLLYVRAPVIFICGVLCVRELNRLRKKNIDT